jgi:hypothetical protein
MVKVYSVLLALGFVAIVLIVFGGALAENLGHPERDPNELIGQKGRIGVGALLGFAMGGMAAEFSPLDLSWQVALAIAVGAGVVGAYWTRYAASVPAES